MLFRENLPNMLHFVLCTSGECRDRGRGRQSDGPATFCAVYKWRVQGQGTWQAAWRSTDLLPAAQCVDVYSPGTQEEELTAVTDHRLVARLFSSKCLQQVIMDSGVLCPDPHDHTYPHHGYWCLMAHHMITHTHIMDTGVLCPHQKNQTYPHHGYCCLMYPPAWSHIPTSWTLVSYVPSHMITYTHIMATIVLCPTHMITHHGFPHPHDQLTPQN